MIKKINNYQEMFNEILKNKLKYIHIFTTYKVSNLDVKTFILFLQKVLYSCEYIDDWKNFIEVLIPEKKDFYSHLNIEETTHVNYMHVKWVCQDFEIKHLVEYLDLYFQSDILLLADVFENFQNICFHVHELDPTHFLCTLGYG